MKLRVQSSVLSVLAACLCWAAVPDSAPAQDAAAAAVAAEPSPQQTRARAWDGLTSNLSDEKYLNHSLAVEAFMRELAVAIDDDADEWGLAGLLHDIDIGLTSDDPSRHGLAGARILRDLGMSEPVVHAVSAHDNQAGIARSARIDHALYCADQTYWMINSTGRGFPSPELSEAVPEAIWAEVQKLPSKKEILGEVSGECARIGLSMPQVFGGARAASSEFSRPATVR